MRVKGVEVRRITMPSGASVGCSTGMNLFAENHLLDTRILSVGGADPAADLIVKLQLQSENTQYVVLVVSDLRLRFMTPLALGISMM